MSQQINANYKPMTKAPILMHTINLYLPLQIAVNASFIYVAWINIQILYLITPLIKGGLPQRFNFMFVFISIYSIYSICHFYLFCFLGNWINYKKKLQMETKIIAYYLIIIYIYLYPYPYPYLHLYLYLYMIHIYTYINICFALLCTLFFLFPGKTNGHCEGFYNGEVLSLTCCYFFVCEI